MRAHVLTKYAKTNATFALREVPVRPLAPDEVRIELEAAALNPVDLKTRAGEPKMLLPFSPPFIPGVDLAGRVSELGAAAAGRGLAVGDAVFAYAGMDRMGTFAEIVTLPAARVARAPAGLEPARVACLPLAGLCALGALDAGRVERGARVLIHGGIGGVGSLAIQLAHQRGAEVFTTVAARDLDHARALGAAHAIDYRGQRFEMVARSMDFVFDTVGGETLARSWSTLAPGGTLASLHVPPPADTLSAAGLRAPWFLRALLPLVTRGPRAAARRAGAHLVPILTVPDASALDRLARIAEHPGLSVHLDRVFPFEALGEALDHLASGQARGRVVLAVRGPRSTRA